MLLGTNQRPAESGKRDAEQAIAHFRECLSLVPTSWASVWATGKAKQAIGDHREALTWFERARADPGARRAKLGGVRHAGCRRRSGPSRRQVAARGHWTAGTSCHQDGPVGDIMRILVVEDSATQAQALEFILTTEGFDVEIATARRKRSTTTARNAFRPAHLRCSHVGLVRLRAVPKAER
jgi:CheY-like chemotaxis protein